MAKRIFDCFALIAMVILVLVLAVDKLKNSNFNVEKIHTLLKGLRRSDKILWAMIYGSYIVLLVFHVIFSGPDSVQEIILRCVLGLFLVLVFLTVMFVFSEVVLEYVVRIPIESKTKGNILATPIISFILIYSSVRFGDEVLLVCWITSCINIVLLLMTMFEILEHNEIEKRLGAKLAFILLMSIEYVGALSANIQIVRRLEPKSYEGLDSLFDVISYAFLSFTTGDIWDIQKSSDFVKMNSIIIIICDLCFWVFFVNIFMGQNEKKEMRRTKRTWKE